MPELFTISVKSLLDHKLIDFPCRGIMVLASVTERHTQILALRQLNLTCTDKTPTVA